MLHLLETSTTSKLFLVSSTNLFFVLLFLGSSGVSGASFRDTKLWGSESGSQRGNAHTAPNVDMIKALEYIESLRQRTGTDSQQQHGALAAGYDPSDMDDAEELRAMLRLASNPMQSKDDEEEEEEEEEEGDEGREDKSAELLQAVLSTLQQAEKASKPLSLRPSADEEDTRDNSHRRGQQKQHGIPLHKKLPLMFEDEEEGEEEEGEAPGLRHLKRTNENVEEKYTPQNLATLQSVFDELDKMTRSKVMHKRQDDDEEEEGDDDDDDDDDDGVFNVRNVAYDDVGRDLALDWSLLQEQDEDNKEDEDDKHDVDRELDYVDDNDEDVDEDDEGEEDENYPVKRSKVPDDDANLVDYYLLKVLEKTEEEEQKRELEVEEEEEQERAERRAAAQTLYRDDIFPRTIYEFIQISQKYKIPPEDLMDMLKSGRTTYQAPSQQISKLSRVQNKLSQIKKMHALPEARFSSRRLPVSRKSPEQLRTEAILRVLGLDGTEERAPVRKQQQSRLHAQPARRLGESAPTQRRFPGTLKDNGDDTMDEDELAAYLTAQMPAQFLKPTYKAAVASQKRDDGGESVTGSFEQNIQDYFDHGDSEKSPEEKRQSEDEDRSAGFENEAVIKLLSFLNPETTEETDTDAKTVQK
uniref:secretogranin-2 isoform X2 n=1 Tax=Solea senegalensis TaxID=28829 RepID=UPI001CD86A78|nr:secretogranin-2 isoform X2 [Solea senegalensis]